MESTVDESVSCNFVSSYNWSRMSQSIPLHCVVRHSSMARVAISAKFMGMTGCPSVFKLQVVVMNSQRRWTSLCPRPTLPTILPNFTPLASYTGLRPVESENPSLCPPSQLSFLPRSRSTHLPPPPPIRIHHLQPTLARMTPSRHHSPS